MVNTAVASRRGADAGSSSTPTTRSIGPRLTRRVAAIDEEVADLDSMRIMRAVPKVPWDKGSIRDINAVLRTRFERIDLDPVTWQPVSFVWRASAPASLRGGHRRIDSAPSRGWVGRPFDGAISPGSRAGCLISRPGVPDDVVPVDAAGCRPSGAGPDQRPEPVDLADWAPPTVCDTRRRRAAVPRLTIARSWSWRHTIA